MKLTRIQLVKSGFPDYTVFGESSGRYDGGNDINIKKSLAASDSSLQTTIFHELLHMDEALAVVYDSIIRYVAHGIIFNFGHDPRVSEESMQYGIYLLGPEASKPDLSNEPWRCTDD